MIGEISGPPFEVGGALPVGVTVLEASAGTGKTYTIASLAARYVAEGLALDRMLLVTFTRMATGELRERVRDRLLDVERGLERASAGSDETSGRDEVVALLARGAATDVRVRRDRLRRALTDFDAATIATTHGFCQEVLGGLSIAGDLRDDVTFVEDIDDLVEEVVDDLYVRRFHRGDIPPFRRAEAAQIARMAVENPAAPIARAVGEVAQMRRRLALSVRDELERRKRRLAVMTYDDLLTRLDQALAGPRAETTAATLRARFEIVLVDEFQDTDPVQWSIMRRAFGQTGCTLVLIGDPKQAIYAFRGGDVYAYLDAARAATTRATLGVNRRSDQGLIDAYDALLAGVKLGHEGIVYNRVRAAPGAQAPRLTGAPHGAALRIRVLARDSPSVKRTPSGYASNASAREHIAQDLAGDLVALLSAGAEIERRSDDGRTLDRVGLRPGHVAVLVSTNRKAALIREALDNVGIPAVINGAGSVFGSASAREWLRLLEAIERPASPSRAHSAALTCFVGWSAETVASAGEEEWGQLHRRLHDWAAVLRRQGVAALTETVTLAERLPQRILTATDGERRLTDLRHVGQLLHAAATAEQMGTTALTAWLRRRTAEAAQDTGDEERSRRLESDAEAVSVLTVHRSKGLEFPIVYLPFLWEPFSSRERGPVCFHDPDAADARTIDVSLQGADFTRHRQQSIVEQRGEDLRLAYVALTRAQHQAVLWWAGSWDTRHSALTRLLFARDADGNVAPSCDFTPDDAGATERLQALAADAPGSVAVERSTLGLPSEWAKPPIEAAELRVATFDRALDWRWRRTSYSDITARTYEASVASEPEEAVLDDESLDPSPPAMRAPGTGVDTEHAPGNLVALLADMPVGVRVGTIVHRVLEATDFAAQDLDGELATQITAAQGRRPVHLGDQQLVVGGLRAALETPLGPPLDGLRLRDVRRADRLDELEFELPLAGGDDPTGRLTLAAVAAVLTEHLDAGDPLAGYADRLGDPALRQSVGGFLTGSLDLVVRVANRGSPASRFWVLDYKTNRLGGPAEQLSSRHYHPAALAAEMQRAHYGLQALLYTVALHRYLRWRLSDYDVRRNLGGVLYLFLRGMLGPQTPTVGQTPYGVFTWRAPARLVEALSDVLDAGGAHEQA